MPEGLIGRTLADLLGGLTRELARGSGPVKWCKRCGRKHPTRARCDLVAVAVKGRSGRMVERKIHRSRAS